MYMTLTWILVVLSLLTDFQVSSCTCDLLFAHIDAHTAKISNSNGSNYDWKIGLQDFGMQKPKL